MAKGKNEVALDLLVVKSFSSHTVSYIAQASEDA
jgi:hypothetical protein